MWNLQTVAPSDLSNPPPNYIQVYDDNDDSFNHSPNGVPHINTALATSGLNPPGPSSSNSATPITPGLLSPSHPGYASSPSLLDVTPPTPVYTLGPDNVYHTIPSSAPVSPYPPQHSPWHIANVVRILSLILPL